MNFQEFIKAKWATWVLGPVLLVVMILTAKVIIQKHRIDVQVAQLQARVDKIKKDNDQLSSLIQYFNTQQYAEKEARDKLSLKKDGEYVVGLPNNDQPDATTSPDQQKSNFKQWLNYFFAKN